MKKFKDMTLQEWCVSEGIDGGPVTALAMLKGLAEKEEESR